VATLGEPESELLVEAVETADVRQDHDSGRESQFGKRLEGCESVPVLALEDEIVMGNGRAEDAGDRRLRVELETHRAAAYDVRSPPCQRSNPSARR
jgi:hypothetical protein